MSLEKAISTKEINDKLANLKEYMTDADDFICRVAEYFGERLERHGEINPMGFVNVFNLMVYDLKKGVDGFTGQPVPHALSGQPPQLYAVLSMYAPILAKEVCPEDFAQGVKEFCDEVKKMLREGR